MESKMNVNRTAQKTAESPPPPDTTATPGAQPPGHEVPPGKRFCEAGPGWCRVCEKMSDIPVLRSEDLLQGRREVLIIHGDEVYRLLCTRNNKLILQK
jgi:hemin uptake protein HemP